MKFYISTESSSTITTLKTNLIVTTEEIVNESAENKKQVTVENVEKDIAPEIKNLNRILYYNKL